MIEATRQIIAFLRGDLHRKIKRILIDVCEIKQNAGRRASLQSRDNVPMIEYRGLGNSPTSNVQGRGLSST